MELYDRIVNPNLLIRRLNLTANHVVSEQSAQKKGKRHMSSSLFLPTMRPESSSAGLRRQSLKREKKMQQAVLILRRNSARMPF